MRRTKQKRLESKGWKVGDTKAFLGLAQTEAAFIEVKLALADRLRVRRERRNLTQEQLARLLKSSQSRVAKMEAGDSSVSIDLLVRSLLVLGDTRIGVSRIIDPANRSAAA